MRVLILAVAFLAFSAVALASGTTTSWNVATGDWSEASNWTDGEPTIDCPALIPTGTASITQAGEICSDLTVSASSGLSFVQMTAGSLEVPGATTLSAGLINHFGGAATLGRLYCGGESGGSYTFGSGTLDIGTCFVGSGTATGSLACSAGGITVTDSLVVGLFGAFTVSGFSVDADLGHVVLNGGFGVANGPRPILAETFVMGENSRMLATLGPGNVSVIQVSGKAILAGEIEIQDSQDAPDGNYELLRGNPLEGGFTKEKLPEGWGWFIEGNSMFLRKGDDTPVESTTWGGIKNSWAKVGN